MVRVEERNFLIDKIIQSWALQIISYSNRSWEEAIIISFYFFRLLSHLLFNPFSSQLQRIA